MKTRNTTCIYVATALINMYGKCGSMFEAQQVFNSIKHPNLVSWTVLILGYAENGEGMIGLDLFAKMKCEGYTPDSVTFVAALKACTAVALKQDRRSECRELGKRIHSEIGSYSSNIYVQCALIDMYAKCGSMIDSRQVFDSMKYTNVVSWNALIMGYSENGEGIIALDLLVCMRSQGCPANCITFVAALKACIYLALEHDGSGKAEYLERGKQIHSQISFPLDRYLQGTLVGMYARFGKMVEARQVFDSIKDPDVVSWTAVILGYAENGDGSTALDLFANMKSQGCAPNFVTYAAAIKACCMLEALELGRSIHVQIVGCNVILVTCLIDFYAKCGNIVESQKVFDSHPSARDGRTWTALLAGYSRLGDMKSVLGLFEGMQVAGFQPNAVTFICVLTCCNHAGLLENANKFFNAMATDYGIIPSLDHYNIIIDVLGRSNQLDDVLSTLRSMPCRPDAVTWMAVLSACRKWENVETGRLAFKYLVSSDDSSAACSIMAHIYASRYMFEEQEMVLGMRKNFKKCD